MFTIDIINMNMNHMTSKYVELKIQENSRRNKTVADMSLYHLGVH